MGSLTVREISKNSEPRVESGQNAAQGKNLRVRENKRDAGSSMPQIGGHHPYAIPISIEKKSQKGGRCTGFVIPLPPRANGITISGGNRVVTARHCVDDAERIIFHLGLLGVRIEGSQIAAVQTIKSSSGSKTNTPDVAYFDFVWSGIPHVSLGLLSPSQNETLTIVGRGNPREQQAGPSAVLWPSTASFKNQFPDQSAFLLTGPTHAHKGYSGGPALRCPTGATCVAVGVIKGGFSVPEVHVRETADKFDGHEGAYALNNSGVAFKFVKGQTAFTLATDLNHPDIARFLNRAPLEPLGSWTTHYSPDIVRIIAYVGALVSMLVNLLRSRQPRVHHRAE
jgi:hypothetical protein